MLAILYLIFGIPFIVCFVLDIFFIFLWFKFAKMVFKIIHWLLDVACWILFLILIFVFLVLV